MPRLPPRRRARVMLGRSAMRSLPAVLCAAFVLVAPAVMMGFEGTLKLRSATADRDKLAKLAGTSKEPDAQQTMAITMEKLKDGGTQVFESTMYISGPKVRMDAPMEKG